MFTNFVVSHITRAHRPSISAAFAMWKRNLTKACDRITERETSAPKLAEEKRVEDAFALRTQARRITHEMMTKEEMVPGALEFVIDTLRVLHSPSAVLEDCWDDILSRPGAGMALTELLVYAEWLSTQEMDENAGEIRFRDFLGMFGKIISEARSRLAVYREILQWNRDHKNDPGFVAKEITDRPADIYRDFGGALRFMWARYADEDARRVLAQLELETTMPINELDNPDWLDAYTGRSDAEYEQVRLKKQDISSDGNSVPQYIADLIESLGDKGETFETELVLHGSSMQEYHRQFMQAQRSGYSEMIGAELELENGADDYDSNDKDFQFSDDLKVDLDTASALKRRFQAELDGVSVQIDIVASKFDEWRKDLEVAEVKYKFDWAGVHHAFLKSPEVAAFLKVAQDFLRNNPPQELMAVLLPFQNKFGFWEEDFYHLRVSPEIGSNLKVWYDIFGDEFLEQYMGSENSRNYDEVPMDLLDEMAFELVYQMQKLYNRSEERRVRWNESGWKTMLTRFMADGFTLADRFLAGEPLHIELRGPKAFPYRADVHWHSAFVNAEVQMAVMGDGGSASAQAAGYDAWRESIDPEANREYKRQVARGLKPKQAMVEFWKVANANRNRIASVARDGITLKSGRKIDWGIARLKIQANEIPLTAAEVEKLIGILKQFQIGGSLMPALVKKLAQLKA